MTIQPIFLTLQLNSETRNFKKHNYAIQYEAIFYPFLTGHQNAPQVFQQLLPLMKKDWHDWITKWGEINFRDSSPSVTEL